MYTFILPTISYHEHNHLHIYYNLSLSHSHNSAHTPMITGYNHNLVYYDSMFIRGRIRMLLELRIIEKWKLLHLLSFPNPQHPTRNVCPSAPLKEVQWPLSPQERCLAGKLEYLSNSVSVRMCRVRHRKESIGINEMLGAWRCQERGCKGRVQTKNEVEGHRQ